MALVRCPECGHQVSSQAPACPSCGYPLQKGAAPPAPQQNALQSALHAGSTLIQQSLMDFLQ